MKGEEQLAWMKSSKVVVAPGERAGTLAVSLGHEWLSSRWIITTTTNSVDAGRTCASMKVWTEISTMKSEIDIEVDGKACDRS